MLDPSIDWTLAPYNKSAAISDLPSEAKTLTYVPVPVCIHDSKALLKDQKKTFGRYSSKGQLNGVLPEVILDIGFNDYLVVDYKLNTSSQLPYQLDFDPEMVASEDKTTVTLTTPGLLTQDPITPEKTISACTSAD